MAQKQRMTQKSSQSTATRLADDVLYLIFANLGANDLPRMSLVCKQWSRVADSNRLWGPLYTKAFPKGSTRSGSYKSLFYTEQKKVLERRQRSYKENRRHARAESCFQWTSLLMFILHVLAAILLIAFLVLISLKVHDALPSVPWSLTSLPGYCSLVLIQITVAWAIGKQGGLCAFFQFTAIPTVVFLTLILGMLRLDQVFAVHAAVCFSPMYLHAIYMIVYACYIVPRANAQNRAVIALTLALSTLCEGLTPVLLSLRAEGTITGNWFLICLPLAIGALGFLLVLILALREHHGGSPFAIVPTMLILGYLYVMVPLCLGGEGIVLPVVLIPFEIAALVYLVVSVVFVIGQIHRMSPYGDLDD